MLNWFFLNVNPIFVWGAFILVMTVLGQMPQSKKEAAREAAWRAHLRAEGEARFFRNRMRWLGATLDQTLELAASQLTPAAQSALNRQFRRRGALL